MKATIELQGKLRAPVSAVVRSPSGASSNVRLRRATSTLWRGSFKFPYSGAWTVRARGISKRVLVQVRLVPPPPASSFVPLGEPDCRPPSPVNGMTQEARGAAKIGDLWALGFGPDLADSQQAVLRGVVGTKFKIVWRMRGSGPARFTATAPDGTRKQPAQLQRHTSSGWNRPGAEWGSTFVFTRPGCWQIHAKRTNNQGDLWVLVRS